jgi:hypothetical protein
MDTRYHFHIDIPLQAYTLCKNVVLMRCTRRAAGRLLGFPFWGLAPGCIRRRAAAFSHRPKALCGLCARVLVPFIALYAL